MGISKLSLVLRRGLSIPSNLNQKFEWEELDNGKWKFTNGTHTAEGYFITVLYSGAHKGNPNEHSLRLGDVMGVRQGHCWRVKASTIPNNFDSYGIALGWYEENDAALIMVSGYIKDIGEKWTEGSRVYLPFYGFGKPEQTKRSRTDRIPIGIALTKTDMLLIPRLDI